MNDALYKLLDGARVNVDASNPSRSRQLTVAEREELLAALRAADEVAQLRDQVKRLQATEETAGADDAG